MVHKHDGDALAALSSSPNDRSGDFWRVFSTPPEKGGMNPTRANSAPGAALNGFAFNWRGYEGAALLDSYRAPDH
jgi:hypothetical protein